VRMTGRKGADSGDQGRMDPPHPERSEEEISFDADEDFYSGSDDR